VCGGGSGGFTKRNNIIHYEIKYKINRRIFLIFLEVKNFL
jgi:hypothetical protein